MLHLPSSQAIKGSYMPVMTTKYAYFDRFRGFTAVRWKSEYTCNYRNKLLSRNDESI
jgi:hypothetical protein